MSSPPIAGYLKISLAIVALALALIAASIILDLGNRISYSVVTFNGTGDPGKSALVVYDGGLTGTGNRIAMALEREFHDRGYRLKVASIGAPGIEGAAGFHVIFVISPTYPGGPSAPISRFLGNASFDPDALVVTVAVSGLLGDNATPRMADALEARGIAVAGQASLSPWDRDLDEHSYAIVYSLPL